MDRDVECARHPGRPALNTCNRCDRAICAEDLVEAPVGYQCVDCARSAPPVRRLGEAPSTPPATRTLVLAIVAVAVAGTTGAFDARSLGLVPALVGLGEWWRILTSALLHAGIVHLAFNGLLLWRLGQLIEPRVGAGTFLGLTASGLTGGGLGVVGVSWLAATTPLGAVPLVRTVLGGGPFTVTVGASGAVFGLMGAFLVLLRRRGIDPRTTTDGSTVVALVLLNLVLTLAVPTISVGGHVGGLLGGAAAAMLVRADGPGSAGDTARTSALAIALMAAAVAHARSLVAALLP